MTYTIDELEVILAEWDSATHREQRVIILHGITALETIALKRQLLDTMRALEAAQARIVKLETFDSPAVMLEHAQMKARIEAAAAIPARDMADASDVEEILAAGGANEMRAQFRAALGVEGE